MFCERCGSPLEEGFKFCGTCGTPVAAAPQPPVPVAVPPIDISSIDLQTADGMLAFARQFCPAVLPVYTNAFQEVEKNLMPDEKVHFAFTGTSLSRRQASMLWYVGIAITDTRLIIGGQIKGLIKVSYSAQSFTLDNINSVSEAYSAIIGGDLVIDTLGDDLRIGEGSREIVNNLMPKINKVLMELKAKKASGGTTIIQEKTSPADDIRKFKELMDEGIITPEEFAAKKKQILGL